MMQMRRGHWAANLTLVGLGLIAIGCGESAELAVTTMDGSEKVLAYAPPRTQYGVEPLLITDAVSLPANMDPAKSASGYTVTTPATDCSSCHWDEYEQWEYGTGGDLYPVEVFTGGERYGAMHRLSYLDNTFHHHYVENGSKDSCLRCHTPDTAYSVHRSLGTLAPNSRPATSENILEGITCVSCHLDEDGNIRGEHSYDGADGSHAVIADDVMFGDGHTLCASCHNDPFWGALNNTYKQWEEQAKDSGLTCVSCHMVDTSDFFTESHSFPGAHSATLIDAAIGINIPERIGDNDTFSIEACNDYAGHNLPSGDQFRAYVLKANVRDDRGSGFFGEKWISALFRTPVMVEVVDYDRIEPIPFGECVQIPFERLDAGEYTVEFELGLWLVKPIEINVKFPPWADDIDAEGEVYRVVRTQTIDLVVED